VSGRPFEPPAYPYDRLEGARLKAATHEGGVVDLSVGTPCDAPPEAALSALAAATGARGYPASVGSAELRGAAVGWMRRRFGVEVAPEAVAACVGTKEMVASTPHWLSLRDPSRDSVLYPGLSYPTYAMGAVLAGLRPVAVPVDGDGRLVLEGVSDADAERALLLWVNSPGNPAGQTDDLAAVAGWARQRGVAVFSDECYTEMTWKGRPRTILEHGVDGLVAVHSLSKRSNLAGLRVGFYAGDEELVRYLSEVRKHAGLMVAGPAQAAASVALGDDEHVARQRSLYLERLEMFRAVLEASGAEASLPEGGFYLWARAPDGSGSDADWGFTERLAAEGGVLVSPGEFFGEAGRAHVRVAMVQPLERLELVARRLGCS
jgi:succinyldiaminopimelate transaminase